RSRLPPRRTPPPWHLVDSAGQKAERPGLPSSVPPVVRLLRGKRHDPAGPTLSSRPARGHFLYVVVQAFFPVTWWLSWSFPVRLLRPLRANLERRLRRVL